jgi:hypothetical protein
MRYISTKHVIIIIIITNWLDLFLCLPINFHKTKNNIIDQIWYTYLLSALEIINEVTLEIIEGLSVYYTRIQEGVKRPFYKFVQIITILFQVLLQKLKQTLFLRVYQVITVNVGIFEYLSTPDNFINGFL